MSEVTRRLATKESVDALTQAVNALPNATQAAADAAAAAASQATAAAAAISGMIAKTYSTSNTYHVGEYVYYNSHLYRCIYEIETAEAWTAAHWKDVSIADDVYDLTNGVVAEDKKELICRMTLHQGAISGVDGSIVPNNKKRLYSAPLSTGDWIAVNDGYKIIYSFEYNENGFVGYNEMNRTEYSPGADAGIYVRLVISRSDNTQDISPDEEVIKYFYHCKTYENANIKGFRINGSEYNREDNSLSYLFRVEEGDKITFVPNVNASYFVMVNSYNDSDTTPNYATGYSTYGVEVTAGTEYKVPAGAKFLIVLKRVGLTSDRTPIEININGYNVLRSVTDNLKTLYKDAGDLGLKANAKPIDLIAENGGYLAKELKWFAIGDSYTEINDTQDPTIRAFIKKGYMDLICEKLPMFECTNEGHSGWRFHDWATTSSLARITGGYNLYTIMLGTNDWSQGSTWGTRSDFTNRTEGTSLGSFGKIIDKIKSVAPYAKIIVMTQFHRTVAMLPGATQIEERNHDTYLPNSIGLYFADMEEDIIECCKSEEIPYVDIFTLSKVTPKNAMKFAKVNVNGNLEYLRYPNYLAYVTYGTTITNLYDSTTDWVEYDGCHPSKVGMEIIADLLAEKMKEVMFT